jgi:hypothetical protein
VKSRELEIVWWRCYYKLASVEPAAASVAARSGETSDAKIDLPARGQRERLSA